MKTFLFLILIKKAWITRKLICRSLAKRGELIPLYNKAQEKAAALEKRKKEKGNLLS
jgi:hypothetical protein